MSKPKTVAGLIKELKALQKKAEADQSLANGKEVGNFYKGCAEAYAQVITELKEIDEDGEDRVVDSEAKAAKNLWKGMFLGMFFGGTVLAFLVHWIMQVLAAA